MFHALKTPHEILAKRQIKRRLVNNPKALCANTITTNTQSQEIDPENVSVINKKKKKLQELKKLFDEGLITSEDYEQQKKQILGLWYDGIRD